MHGTIGVIAVIIFVAALPHMIQRYAHYELWDQDRTECIAELLAVEDLAQNLAASLASQLAAQARDGQPCVEGVVPGRYDLRGSVNVNGNGED